MRRDVREVEGGSLENCCGVKAPPRVRIPFSPPKNLMKNNYHGLFPSSQPFFYLAAFINRIPVIRFLARFHKRKHHPSF